MVEAEVGGKVGLMSSLMGGRISLMACSFWRRKVP